jgi:hypothetical protein
LLTAGHRILHEALVGHRLLQDIDARLPQKEWLRVLHDV